MKTALLSGLTFLAAWGASAQEVQRGAPVTVTATRIAADPFDVPASIDRIDGDQIRDGRLQVNLSESLATVPGLALANRQNYAQDLQLSIRGFGARSTFGIRGVRLYVDGIPATLPDGQGQLSNIDLSSVDRIEVLRGPFSALYGNSSGGVVQAFTEDGVDGTRLTPSFAAGSDATLRAGLKASGTMRFAGEPGARLGYVVSGSHFETDGPRAHSTARRDLGNAKLVLDADADTRVTLVVNSVDLPRADDPLGLTRAQFSRDPRSVDPSALQFDTRKTFSQTQGGLILDRRLGEKDRLRVLVYAGQRSTQQFQSIPVATQNAITSPGGVIDLDRRYSGVDVRWTHTERFGEQRLDLIAGVAADRLQEHRKGYENFSGPPAARVLGVQGNLRRDEDNDVRNLDPYLQASWKPNAAWVIDAGVRHSLVRFTSFDHYVVRTATGVNPDDSGAVRYQATTPVGGVLYAPLANVHLYATAGRGFETPTFNELSYRADGGTGLNFGLRPAKSTSLEAGVKSRLAMASRPLLLNVALYRTRVRDELSVLSNTGGRSTFTNAGRTQRWGVEVAADWTLLEDLRLRAAYTYLDARYRDGFLTCSGTPCTVPSTPVPAGNRIPGVAANVAAIELAYAPRTGWRAGLEGRSVGKVWVDDVNSDAVARYAVANARIGYGWRIERWTLESFARVDNLFDRTYAGSVIVNEGNGRFFEPAAGRQWLVGATLSVDL